MAKQNDTIDLGAIIATARRYWYFFVAAVLGCLLLAFAYTKISHEKYLVKANLLISQDDAGDQGGGMSGALSSIFGSSANVDDEVFLVQSHSVLRQVVKNLRLNVVHKIRHDFLDRSFCYKDYPVDIYCDAAIPDTLRTSISFKVSVGDDGRVKVKAKSPGLGVIAEISDARFPVAVNTPLGRYVLNKTKYLPAGQHITTDIVFSGYDKATEDIARKIVIDIASRKSNVITLDMETIDIPYAEDILNSIIAQYNERGILEKNKTNEKSLEFIDSRLALLTDDLSASEAAVESYKKNQGIVDVQVEARYNIEKKGKLEEGLIQAETQLGVVKLIRDFITDPANRYELVPASLISNGENNALSSYNALVLKRIELSQNAREGHAALNAINQQIDAMRGNILATVNKAYESAQVTVNELRAEMSSADSRLGNIPTQERQFRDIMRQQTIKEQIYVFLLKQREQTAMLLANAKPKGVVIDRAYALNEPVSMGRAAIFIIAIFLGLILGAVAIYIKQLLRNKFENREELEHLTDVPILGEMIMSPHTDTLVVRDGGSTTASELFRLIRTNLQFVLGNADNKVILLTSTVSGEGKSFISINLASSLALLGKKVLLVGMDIRNPRLAEYLNLPPAPGFTEYIAGNHLSLDDIIRKNPVGKNLDIITAGPIPPNPAELLNDPKVDQMFSTLRERYDYIIIDSAPVGMVSDTFCLVRLSDATVYVTRANYSTLKEVKFFNTLYDEGRLKKMSLVINGTKPGKGYGYGYGRKKE